MHMNRILLLLTIAATAAFGAVAATEPHPWSGKKVVYLGDSITDPSQIARHNHSTYWKYMQELYGIEPHVYAVSGYQWNRIYPMAQKMQSEMGDTPDAILILLGTNDFNSGVPLGEWYQVSEEDVNRRGVTIRQPRRCFAKNMGTFRGRINTVMEYLKHNFPDQQIVIMEWSRIVINGKEVETIYLNSQLLAASEIPKSEEDEEMYYFSVRQAGSDDIVLSETAKYLYRND